MYEKRVDEISDRYSSLYAEIENYVSEENLEMPKLLAVSKTRSIDEIQIAIDAGIQSFGENYPQELALKAGHFSKFNIEWHFIGHLQRRNTKFVIPYTKYIHSLDSLKLARKLSNQSYSGECFIQINISEESSKFGIKNNIEELVNLMQSCQSLNIKITGLMGIPNSSWNEKMIQEAYNKLYIMGTELGLKKFSMGMSNDWKIALSAGATIIRIGTAIFGPRI